MLKFGETCPLVGLQVRFLPPAYVRTVKKMKYPKFLENIGMDDRFEYAYDLVKKYRKERNVFIFSLSLSAISFGYCFFGETVMNMLSLLPQNIFDFTPIILTLGVYVIMRKVFRKIL